MQLTKSEQNSIDAFQMKMLREILRVPSTYIDRAWTNQRIIDTLCQQFGYQHVSLSNRWKLNKIRLLGHILRAPPLDPMRGVLFESGTFTPRIEHTRRVGKPRAHWLLEACQDTYALINPHLHTSPKDVRLPSIHAGTYQCNRKPKLSSNSSNMSSNSSLLD